MLKNTQYKIIPRLVVFVNNLQGLVNDVRTVFVGLDKHVSIPDLSSGK